MLSATSTAVVRATLPAVGESLDAITERFYGRMFAAHPELLRDLFNRGNQASGAQRRALAGAVAAFATALVEHPGTRPDTLLSRIAHKHASLGITPGQYRIVHTHLMAAIAEVLGDAVTEEVAAAWDEVYWLMANALIALESRLYRERGILYGTTWREYEVVARSEEAADVAVFQLRPADGSAVPGFSAGQYISVQVQLPDGARQIRQYSLICAPGAPTHSIAVKRVHGGGTPDGEVSNHLHARVREGDRLTVSAPYGDLVLGPTDAPLLLISAGIGCTPMLSMLEHLVATGHRSPVTAVHADRSPDTHAARVEHARLTEKLPGGAAHFWYEQPDPGWPSERTGQVDLSGMPLPEGVQVYLCGPLPFMRDVRAQLLALGVPPADVHYEVFGPDLWLADLGQDHDAGASENRS